MYILCKTFDGNFISMGYFFSTEQFVTVFFPISVKHKIVFALQCISMIIFHRRGYSQFGTGKNDDEHDNTQNFKTIYFFNKYNIALKLRKNSSELFGTVTNSDEQ